MEPCQLPRASLKKEYVQIKASENTIALHVLHFLHRTNANIRMCRSSL